MNTSSHFRLPPSRRGALLLLVLTSLSLFMMIGAAMLVIATRSRTAARAFSDATNSTANGSIQASAMLDEALMVLLRGSKSALPTGIASSESILEDKYGSLTVSGSATLGLGLMTNPIISATFSGPLQPPVSSLSRFAGRILTVKPAAGQGTPVSYRIVGVSGSTAYLSNIAPRPLAGIVSGSTYAFCINGREFTPVSGTTTPENYDGYDAANAWLAQPVVTGTPAGVRFQQLSYSSNAAVVDNDNDGFLDGDWISGTSGFLADRPSQQGGLVRYRVSYLVLDLDGRINLNAAGMTEPLASGSGSPPAVPLGMGYGPADLDASLVLAGALPVASGTSAFTGGGANAWSSIWGRLLRGGQPIQSQSTATQRRQPPVIGQVTGRYGTNGLPGTSGDDTSASQATSGTATNPTYRWLVSGTTGNVVADLKGQLRVTMTSTNGSPAAELTFTKATTSGTFADDDFIDDPYEIRLDAGGRRLATSTTGMATLSDDNTFTLGDLERLLRANDADASALPTRLPAVLEDRAQAVRFSMTSDSWDTPALTGTAARLLEDAIAIPGTCRPIQYPWAPDNVLSPDVAAGLRFDLNRVVTTPTQKTDYCRGLYTLTVLLGATNRAAAAQWAVNVLDFRDEDSTMTRFEYDENLADGWNPSGTACVYGVERPEVVIAQTAAWRSVSSGSGELFVNLYRPPRSAVIRTGTGAPVSIEQLHPTLGLSDDLEIAKVVSGTNPVWQLRFDTTTGSNKVAWFTQTTTGSQEQFTLAAGGTSVMSGTVAVVAPATSAMAILPDGNLCVQSGSSSRVATDVPFVYANQGGTFRLPAAGTSGIVTLERLADPTRANAADNPYVAVDSAPVTVIDIPDPLLPLPPVNSQRRPGPSPTNPASFWKSPTTSGTNYGPTIVPYGSLVSGSNNPIPWFHWPNRPFISQAELALVPAESPPQLLRQYSIPTSSLAISGTLPLLEATYVPSLFAGNSVMVTGSPATNHGLDKLGVRPFSKWREPGRVNVNTIVSGTSSVVDTDSLVWAALLSGTSLPLDSTPPVTVTTNPFVSSNGSSQPAKSVAELLSLRLSGTAPAVEKPPTVSGGVHPRAANPFLAYATAIRLANTATVRSNVFAVWITLEITDDSASAPTKTFKRLFAIVDRSIPVGFSKGEDLNVRDTIRLVRYLE